MAYYIGIDLGGTNIKAGVLNESARVLSKLSVPTQAEAGPDTVIDNIVTAAQTVAKNAQIPIDEIDYVGIGAPGPLDLEAGVVINAPNMPGWHNVSLRDRVAQKIGRPAVLENDANAAALGEFWAGIGQDESIRHLVMMTLGTGIGAGYVIDGRLVHGAKGRGAEGGHMIVMPDGRPCGCGQAGCIEAYASASNTARRAIERLETGDTSSLETITNAGNQVSSRDVFDAAKAGDDLALEIVDETAYLLAVACVNYCRMLDPQMIVFAGGMILAGDFLFDKIRTKFKELTWTAADDYVEIVAAQLGNDAGFIGAAAVARDRHMRDETTIAATIS